MASDKAGRPSYPDERLGNFVRGLLLGALVGGAVAILKAPRSGAELRALIVENLTAAREGATDLRSEARSAVNDFAAWASEDEHAPAPPASADDLTLTATLDVEDALVAPHAAPAVASSDEPETPTDPLPRLSG